jgi:hypothetical protein
MRWWLLTLGDDGARREQCKKSAAVHCSALVGISGAMTNSRETGFPSARFEDTGILYGMRYYAISRGPISLPRISSLLPHYECFFVSFLNHYLASLDPAVSFIAMN